MHIRDVNIHDIFKNNVLTSQFLRDYTGISIFSDIRPDFTYKVIPLRDFDNNDLKSHQDEMSLILMINKIQGAEDFHEFRQTALDYMNTIYKNTSPDIQQVIQDVIWGLMMKIKIPEEKAT